MAITFPASPSDGDVFTNTTTGVKYIYNATDGVWKTHVWPTNTDYLQLSGGTLTGDLSLGTNDLTAQDITATGSVTVGNGLTVSDGNVVMAAGHGIDFSATADGTGATNISELLDDYEEGEFTPVFRGSTTAGTYTGTFNGFYTKIGNRVSIDIQMSNITANPAGSGGAEIAGLPFAAAAGTGSTGTMRYDSWNVNDAADGLVPLISNTADYMEIFEVGDDRGDSGTNVNDITSGGTDIFISIVYRV